MKIYFHIASHSQAMFFCKKYFVTIILLLSFCATCIAQEEISTMLNKPYTERVVAITSLYPKILYKNIETEECYDSVTILNKAQEIKKIAEANNDKELAMEMDLFMMYYYTAFYTQWQSPEIIISRIEKMIAEADKAGIRHIKIRAMRVLSDYYWHDLKNYEQAFEQYLLMDKELKEVSEHDYPDMAHDLLIIGNAYYYFGEIDRTKYYLERAVKINETVFNTRYLASVKNTLALCYRKEKNYEKAIYYFNEVLNTKSEKTRQEWDGIVKGNLGGIYFSQKEFDKAIPLLEYNNKRAEGYEDFDDAAGSQLTLADIYTQKQDLKKAWTYIERAQKNIDRSKYKGNEEERKKQLFSVLSRWYAANNQVKFSQMYFDSTEKANKEYYESFSAVKILRAQQKILLQEQELKIVELSLAEQKKTAQRNLLILAVIALIAIGFSVYRIQRRKQQINKIQLEAANRELELATQNLISFTQSISEKNQLIEQLQINHSEEDKIRLIHQLQQSTILTDDDWKKFQEVFDHAYPGFITRVKETYTDLSLGEMRFFLLTKLKLSYKEMAGMMGISPNTIHVIRHRVRKKMEFEDNDIMEKTIQAI